jgi:hypothetical protein
MVFSLQALLFCNMIQPLGAFSLLGSTGQKPLVRTPPWKRSSAYSRRKRFARLPENPN